MSMTNLNVQGHCTGLEPDKEAITHCESKLTKFLQQSLFARTNEELFPTMVA
jgi:hypothetical protein